MTIYSVEDYILTEYSWREDHQNVIHATAFEVHDTIQVCHQSYSGRPSIICQGAQSRVSIHYRVSEAPAGKKLPETN